MIAAENKTNEQLAAAAFTKQSAIFDSLYSPDPIIQYKRQRVWDHIGRFLAPESHILELNAGTGEDAIKLANEGHSVHATDISGGMMEILKSKIESQKLKNITQEICSFTELEKLDNKGPYDHIFSNFAGLNCTNDLGKALDSLSSLLKPGGYVTLVLLPRFCLWEFLLLFKGKFRTAFRRFSGSKGTKAKVEGQPFRCWYYNPSFIRMHLQDSYEVAALEGLCTIVPPSYMEGFAHKHTRLYKFLVQQENKNKARWPWKVIGDYYIITLQKKSE